ncbi:MAG: hypothetical protein QXK88_09780 [Desulfurococcaceae archaeon]
MRPALFASSRASSNGAHADSVALNSIRDEVEKELGLVRVMKHYATFICSIGFTIGILLQLRGRPQRGYISVKFMHAKNPANALLKYCRLE